MNEIPTSVYERFLSMSDDEFQLEYTYIRILQLESSDTKTPVEYSCSHGWYHPTLILPVPVDSYRTTADVARCVMDDMRKVRML